MVYDLAKAYIASDDKEPEHKTHMKHPGTTRMPEFVTNISEVVKKNPSKRMKKIAKEMGTHRWTIGHIIKEDMNYKFYVARRHNLLTVSLAPWLMPAHLIANL